MSRKKFNKEFTFTASIDNDVKKIAQSLSSKITTENLNARYSGTAEVLKLVGIGAFVVASFLMPNLPLVVKPLLKKRYQEEKNSWKRFNIPYLKRTLDRLAKQKLVVFKEANGEHIVEITNEGKQQILHYALDEMVIKKPPVWDGTWYMVSYDIPNQFSYIREVLREYLVVWKFYPLHKSIFLHAYKCEEEISFLREYLGIAKYVRVFKVSKIENDQLFRDFFGV